MNNPDRRIMQLGGVRFDRLRGVAIGFDEVDEVVEAVDLADLNSEQRELLKRRLTDALALLEKRGRRLH